MFLQYMIGLYARIISPIVIIGLEPETLYKYFPASGMTRFIVFPDAYNLIRP